MTPLYGHDSESNAYLVSDYPYGGLRCQIKFWLEYKDKKGYRFVSRTQNPKTGKWNAPKHSTYSSVAGAMFLDEKEHCHWDGLSDYSSAEETLKFIQKFPKALTPYLKYWVQKHFKLSSGRLDGSIASLKEVDVERYKKDVENWNACITAINVSETSP